MNQNKLKPYAFALALLLLAMMTLVASATGGGSGAVSLTTLDTASTQNFDSLATSGTTNSLSITGWYLDETGSSGNNNGQYQGGTGSGNGGDTYSFGVAGTNLVTERAFGGLRSGTLVPVIGAKFTNNTGSTITSLDIAYTGEMWRFGVISRATADQLDFQLSTDATSLTTGTWTDYDSLDFVSPTLNVPSPTGGGPLDGNASANRTAKSFTISSLSIANGASFWIRWVDSDISSSDDGLAVDDFSITPKGGAVVDNPPTVTSTSPVDTATDQAVNVPITVTFNEAVTISGSVAVVGGSSGTQNVTPTTSDNLTFTLPHTDFTPGETVTVTITAAQVADQDGTPDNMASSKVFSFTIVNTGPVCDQTFTPIYQIQGSGTSAAITGNVTTEGIVVGDFQTSAGVQGFYIQDPTGDADAATSDGLFVFTGTTDNTVSAGDSVRVTGYARERFSQTTLNGSDSNTAVVPAANILNCGTGSVTAVDVTMPFASTTFPERYEGMLVRFPQTLVIAEYFNYDQFGEIVLALPLDGEDRPFTPTAIDEPGAPAIARAAANAVRRITLDDNQGGSNPVSLRHPNGNPFTLANLFRGGDEVANATGVLGYDFNLYRIFPTAAADYTAINARPLAPEDVGGSLHVAAMNTLNFFITPDYPTGNPLDNKCGPAQNVECRGHDSDQPDEFTRQRDKLLQALAGLDADVIGLNEIENTTGVEPLGDPVDGVVAGLNDIFGAGTYAYIDTGVIGTDAIRVGLIYKPASVTPVGSFETLDSSDDPRFIDTRNRPALAQTFEEVGTGARFTVAVNHLKSKGSACTGDPDLGDGQGNCNVTRTNAAQALVDWLATDPTGSGDPDFLIMGDLNSYGMEDPIDAVKLGADDTASTADDYVNLIAQFQGTYAYSYTFDGQAGYLDHALAINSLASQVTGAIEWHINSDEPDVVDYDTSFKPPSQEALFENDNPYRASDHDPVLIGLDLTVPDTTAPDVTVEQATGQADPTNGSPIHFTVTFTEPVTGFATGDVTLGGTAGATTATVTQIAPNDGTTYDVEVSGMTGDGTVTASVPADAADDGGGNGNNASTSTDNEVTYDTAGPTVTVEQASGQVDPTSASPIHFTVVFSEPVTGFATGDVMLSGTAGATTATVTEVAPNDGTTYNVAVSGMTANGTVIATVAANVAEDGAGNDNTASTSTDNTVTFVMPTGATEIFVSTTAAGNVGPVSFGSEDILKWDGSAWSVWFDGSAAGLIALRARHNINAFYIPETADEVLIAFTQNGRPVPGITGKVDGMDLVRWDGSAFTLYFDGQDVGLTVLTQEKIDGLHALDPALVPAPVQAAAGGSCQAYLLISTAGPGKVPNYSGGQIKFGGEDVLGFCATQLGATTAGKWFLVLDGSAEGVRGNAVDSISASADGQTLYLTTRAAFVVDDAIGGHSMVYKYDFATGEFSGPYFSAPANGLMQKVDGLHVNGELP